jgi:hypothetical protein
MAIPARRAVLDTTTPPPEASQVKVSAVTQPPEDLVTHQEEVLVTHLLAASAHQLEA